MISNPNTPYQIQNQRRHPSGSSTITTTTTSRSPPHFPCHFGHTVISSPKHNHTARTAVGAIPSKVQPGGIKTGTTTREAVTNLRTLRACYVGRSLCLPCAANPNPSWRMLPPHVLLPPILKLHSPAPSRSLSARSAPVFSSATASRIILLDHSPPFPPLISLPPFGRGGQWDEKVRYCASCAARRGDIYELGVGRTPARLDLVQKLLVRASGSGAWSSSKCRTSLASIKWSDRVV